jgi:hypothetical protein
MRYFSYNQYVEDPSTDDYVVTVSEEDIRRDYYPYWYERMCHKYGKAHVDATYCFEDCLYDWIVVNWAWESKDSSSS